MDAVGEIVGLSRLPADFLVLAGGDVVEVDECDSFLFRHLTAPGVEISVISRKSPVVLPAVERGGREYNGDTSAQLCLAYHHPDVMSVGIDILRGSVLLHDDRLRLVGCSVKGSAGASAVQWRTVVVAELDQHEVSLTDAVAHLGPSVVEESAAAESSDSIVLHGRSATYIFAEEAAPTPLAVVTGSAAVLAGRVAGEENHRLAVFAGSAAVQCEG